MDDEIKDDDINEAEAPDDTDDLDDEALFHQLKSWVIADKDFSANWRAEAKKEFSFVAGPGQWDAEDVEVLRREMRPLVTFNKTSKYVRMVCGLEINNRQITTYLPRDVKNVGEVKANEVLTNASDWMSQGCNAPRHQSRAFRDAVICGMGWTEGVIEYDEDPQGRYVETRVNPLEMGWDKDARDYNLTDSKRRWRVREMQIADAKRLIPGVTDKADAADLDAIWIGDTEPNKAKSQQQKELREENTEAYDDPEASVKIVQIQWLEYEDYVRTVDPSTGQSADISEDQYEMANAQWMQISGTPLPRANLKRKVYKQAFVGSKVLSVGPCPNRKGFSFNCITGDPDDVEGLWYGVVRLLRDPQQWSNKFFSQLMHIVNSTAKGGIIAESDAFPDIRQAQSSYARPNAITVVSPGAISKGKIQPKPGTGINGGVLQLMQISDQMFSDTTGMNLEMMGAADRQQPGILEAQRKQSAMTILASLFDSLGAFRMDVGDMRLAYIQDYLADGRLIRIHGDDGHIAVPLIKDQTLGDYDVIVDDAPSSTNMKEKAWAALSMILPAVQHMLTPQVVTMLLDYVPHLPSRLVEELKSMASQPPPPEQVELQKRGAEAEVAKTETDALKNKTAAVYDLARAASERAQQRMATIQAIDAELADAGLIEPRQTAPAIPVDATVMGPDNAGLPPMRPMPDPQQEQTAGDTGLALPGIFGGR